MIDTIQSNRDHIIQAGTKYHIGNNNDIIMIIQIDLAKDKLILKIFPVSRKQKNGIQISKRI